MQRIDASTVELTEAEKAAHRTYQLLLDDGHDLEVTIRKVRAQHPNLDQAFYDWLLV